MSETIFASSNSSAIPGTPEASSKTWYEFFIPEYFQDMVERRLRHLANAKRIFGALGDRQALRAIIQEIFDEDLEVMRVPVLHEERHGIQQIRELRAYIFDSLADLKLKLVDITPEDAQGTAINVRLIAQAKQQRAVFPHLPVNQLVTVGFQLSITLSDRWRPKATCWTFIPVEPLLDLVSMQDMMEASTTADSSPTRSASARMLTPLTPTTSASTMSRQSTPTQTVSTSLSSNQDISEMVKEADTDLESRVAKQVLDHERGDCIPCSFHAFRIDGLL